MTQKQETVKPASLTFIDFSITECQWEHTGKDMDGKLFIKIIPSGKVNTGSKLFQLALDCSIEITNLFKTHIVINGEFGFEEFNEEGRKLCVLNAPAILFPHVRAYISALTALSGLTTVVIPPINMSGMSAQLESRLEID